MYRIEFTDGSVDLGIYHTVEEAAQAVAAIKGWAEVYLGHPYEVTEADYAWPAFSTEAEAADPGWSVDYAPTITSWQEAPCSSSE